jgi:hypothetical protein
MKYLTELNFAKNVLYCHCPDKYFTSELEFIKSLWGLGTEEE